MTSPDLAARPDRFSTPVLFQYGFRPFFLLTGVAACGLIAAWLAVLVSGAWPAGPVGAAAWHGHEMLFGTVVAAVAGFLLTAVPSWTGTKARSGAPLVALVALWVAGRVAVFPWSGVPAPLAALLDVAFLPALGVALAGPLFAAGKARNSAFLLLLALLTLANLLIHLEWLGVIGDGFGPGMTLGLGVVLMMVTVIGGRILPAFTRNGLGADGVHVRSCPKLEKVTLLSTLALVAGELALTPGPLLGTLALVAALAHGVRLARWNGWRAWRSPILWVLHLGYAWIPVALALKALNGFIDLPAASGLHALTAGAFATLILAVMSRASLGHTGRPLLASRTTVAAYLLLTVAALARTAAPLLPGEWLWLALEGAGLAWVLAFALYLAAYAPVLLSPRVDGRPG